MNSQTMGASHSLTAWERFMQKLKALFVSAQFKPSSLSALAWAAFLFVPHLFSGQAKYLTNMSGRLKSHQRIRKLKVLLWHLWNDHSSLKVMQIVPGTSNPLLIIYQSELWIQAKTGGKQLHNCYTFRGTGTMYSLALIYILLIFYEHCNSDRVEFWKSHSRRNLFAFP